MIIIKSGQTTQINGKKVKHKIQKIWIEKYSQAKAHTAKRILKIELIRCRNKTRQDEINYQLKKILIKK